MELKRPNPDLSGQKPTAERIALLSILLLAAAMRCWRLAQNEFGNPYYAAAVRSMSLNWRNFLFASFDPGGFVSVDKPPVALWIQVVFVKILGFTGLALILPQALAGVASVALLYFLVRKASGGAAGLLSALVLAVTPISLAVDRSNNPDSLLVLLLLAAAWALTVAIEKGRVNTLLLCAILIGIAFNVKMMAALVVLPTFTLLYLSSSSLTWGKRFAHLATATVALVSVMLSWPLAVDFTPKSQRPYVGSSQDNSVMSLIVGYNGIGRISGEEGNSPFGGMGGPMGGAAFGGTPGVTRLLQPGMSDQIGWLLPIVVSGGFIALWSGSRGLKKNSVNQQGLLWAGWLLTYGVVYSFAKGIIHQYYLVTMAPPFAALVGIGWVSLWKEYRREDWRGWLFPAILLVTVGWQGRILSEYADWNRTLLPLILGGTLLAAVGLIVAKLMENRTKFGLRAELTAAMLGGFACLLCPLAWAMTPVLGKGNGLLPSAGPGLLNGTSFDPMAMMRMPDQEADALAAYLRDHDQGEPYLLIASDLQAAATLIIRTGEPVAALGGFLGSDPILTPERFARLVQEKQIRYVLSSPMDGFRGGKNAESLEWVRRHGTLVPDPLWHPAKSSRSTSDDSKSSGFPMMRRSGGMRQLYDCATPKVTQNKGENEDETNSTNP